MAAQINYGGDEPIVVDATANIEYVPAEDDPQDFEFILKQGATMPTTGGGFDP